ncbi:MAG: dipeptidase PepV [Eubacterium sp.]
MANKPSEEKLKQAIRQVIPEAERSLQKLVRIDSEKKDPVTAADGTVYPFGQDVEDAYQLFMETARSLGFTTEDADHYGGHVDIGEGREVLGMIGHLDVVPASGKWNFDPFCAEIEDGYMLGRGTTDDKGPMVAALYAVKALLDAGFQPDRKIRIIAGLDEETDWDGLTYYRKKFRDPDFGFSPDGCFPLVNGEKGILNFDFAHKIHKALPDGLQLSKLEGGTARNIVPDHARALLSGLTKEEWDKIKAEAETFAEETHFQLQARKTGKSLEISAHGKAAHASSPEDGLNAISILMKFLGRLDFVSDDINEFIRFYNDHIGFDTTGSGLGFAKAGKYGDDLTFNIGLVKFDKEAISVLADVRYPVDGTAEEVLSEAAKRLDAYHVGLVNRGGEEPMYEPEDSPLAEAMLTAYRQCTGDQDGKAVVLGGGTYAKPFKNMLAFGAQFLDDPDLMHQANEKLPLARFHQSIEIYAHAIMTMADAEFQL